MSDRFDRQAVSNNINDAVDDLRKAQAALQSRSVSGGQLSDITANAGDISAGRFLALSSGSEPTVDGTGAFLSADGETFDDGKVYHVGGVNEGRLMFGLRAEDGAGVFAGGEGLIDADGMHVTGLRNAFDLYATDPDGNNPRRGVLEMFYPEGSTIPALRLRFEDMTPVTELVVNGDFETGDSTGWTGSVSGASTWAVESDGAGGYRGKLLRSGTDAGSVQSDSMTVTAGNRYRFGASVVARNGMPGQPASGTLRVDWYTAGAALINSTTVLNKTAQPYSSPFTGLSWPVIQETISTIVRAPDGAAGARVYATCGTNNYITLGNVTMQLAPMAQEIVFQDGLSPVAKWGTRIVAGIDYDISPANSQAGIVQEVGVLDAMRISKARIDIRNTGSYSLHYGAISPAGVFVTLRTLWSGTVAAAGEITMAFSTPLTLNSGLHYFWLLRDSGATTWWENDAGYDVLGAHYRMLRLSRDSGSTWVSNALGLKFEYEPGIWA